MRLTHKWWDLKVVAVLSAGLGVWTSGEAQRLTWLGDFGGRESAAYGVSADGRVVVGWAHAPRGLLRAFRWENGVMQDLRALPNGGLVIAYGVSADGRVVVGEGFRAAQPRAFRWENGVAQDLGTLGGLRGEARGVSADGRVVVGWAEDADGRQRAFRWENGVMQDLGTLDVDWSSEAYGVSADGRVVVGQSGYRAFRWTAETGMQNLGTLGGYRSEAYGVSADGSVVVGWSYNPRNYARAFRWVQGQGMRGLGPLGDAYSVARGVSADGRVVVGSVSVFGYPRAFRWVQGQGLQDLNQVFASLLTGGSELRIAYAVSLDGRYIVGEGYNAATRGLREAFLLDTWREGDTNGDGCINNADLLNVLFAFGTPGTGYTRHEDINKDGIVNNADLLTVLLNFGHGCQ